MTPKERAEKIVRDLAYVSPEHRGTWLVSKIEGHIEKAVEEALKDAKKAKSNTP